MLETTEEMARAEAFFVADARRGFIESLESRLTRQEFETLKAIQLPIINPFETKGHLNPQGLGLEKPPSGIGQLFRAMQRALSQPTPRGQSSVAFYDFKSYLRADHTGKSPWGGAEYAIPLSPEADAVGQKMAKLHLGTGATVYSSGLSAISGTLLAFDPKAVLIPDNVYFPMERFARARNINLFRYPAGADKQDIEPLLQEALRKNTPQQTMMYIEAPCSGTFEIPEISDLVQQAQKHNVVSVMDNTWASHVRFQPLQHGVDIVIQATTKYEGGFADTPSGVAIARNPEHIEKLRKQLRYSGNGAVSPILCNQLYTRLDTTEVRIDQQYQTALELQDWFSQQYFVKEIISAGSGSGAYGARFGKYFGNKGNGLFTVAFNEPSDQVERFIKEALFFHVAESWGGHVSLALPVNPRHKLTKPPEGNLYRFHAGLEPSRALLYALEEARDKVFGEGPDASRRIASMKPRAYAL